jgi:hypothetical protein
MFQSERLRLRVPLQPPAQGPVCFNHRVTYTHAFSSFPSLLCLHMSSINCKTVMSYLILAFTLPPSVFMQNDKLLVKAAQIQVLRLVW